MSETLEMVAWVFLWFVGVAALALVVAMPVIVGGVVLKWLGVL